MHRRVRAFVDSITQGFYLAVEDGRDTLVVASAVMTGPV